MVRTTRGRSLHLDVESLRVFREVVAQGGFTAASKTLGITQPAVSLKIRRLEERMGIKLILRAGHSFTVTAHGRDLLVHAEKIVEAHDQAVDRMRRSELSGALRLGCSGAVAASGLSEVASRFKRTHPDIDLAIRVDESAIISEMLDSSAIDLALIQLVEVDGAVRSTDVVWRRDELRVIQGLDVDFTDEDPVPLISFGPRSLYHSHLTAVLDAAGRAHRLAMEWPNIRGVQNAIEAGLGVGILNTPAVTEAMKPWWGIDPLEIPGAVFVLRSRSDAEGNELIEALRGHLSEVLMSTFQKSESGRLVLQ